MRRTEEEIRKLISGLEQSVGGIAIGGTNLKLSYVNDAFAEMHGYSPEEMVGLAVMDLQDEGDANDSKAMMNHLRKHGSWSGKTRHIRRHGETFPVYMSITSLEDYEGNPSGTFMVVRDITNQEEFEAKLHHTQKLDALGTFAGGVAHNFNNLLMAIMGNVSLVLLTSEPGDEHHEALKRIEMLVEKGSQLTKQLLVVAGKRGMYELKPIALDRILKKTCDAFAAANDEIAVYRELAEDLRSIEADEGQIQQAIWNLFVNAADAMPGGGELYLKSMNVTHKTYEAKSVTQEPATISGYPLRIRGWAWTEKPKSASLTRSSQRKICAAEPVLVWPLFMALSKHMVAILISIPRRARERLLTSTCRL